MKHTLILLLIVLIGCSSIPSDADLEDIKTDMAHVNKGLRAKILRKKEVTKFKELSEENYLVLINKWKVESELEFINFYKKFMPEVAFKTSETNFGVCIRSKTAKVFMCDNARTSKLDTDKKDLRNYKLHPKDEIEKLDLDK